MSVGFTKYYNSSGTLNLDYKWGNGGQLKDDEISGRGNHYTAMYWEYDPRIGSGGRWNIDPVLKPWESPYTVFKNSPIGVIDPNGDDGKGTKDKEQGTATLEAHIIFQNDGTVSDEMFNQYVSNFMQNVQEFYTGRTFEEGDQTYKLNLDKVTYSVASPDANIKPNKKYENVLTVGSTGISHIDGTRGNTGFLNVNDGGNTAAHEFGHLFGLTDRYAEGLAYGNDDALDGSDAARFTIELSGIRDYQANNLMAVGGNHLTNKQLGHMINNTTERNYPKDVVIGRKGTQLRYNQIQVRSIMGLKLVKANAGTAEWASPFLGGFQTGGTGDARRILRKNGLGVSDGNRKLVRQRSN